MKKQILLAAFALVAGRGFSQNTPAPIASGDSMAVAKVVDSLLAAGKAFLVGRKFQEALPPLQLAGELTKQKWGENNARFATSLHGQAFAKGNLGQSDEAIELYNRAVETWAKAIGKDNTSYARSLNNLAIQYYQKGQLAKVEPLFLEITGIMGRLLGKEHPDYATSVDNLGNLYKDLGDYEKAEKLLLEGRDIRAKSLGKEHANYGQSMANLGILYYYTGNFAKAEPAYIEAVEIYAKTLGKEHPWYAMNLLNLAALYMTREQFDKAEPLFMESKGLTERLRGKNNLDYAQTLTNLGSMARAQGDYPKSEAFYLEANAIWEALAGRESHDYARALAMFANLYITSGQLDKAEPMMLEAVRTQTKLLGKDNPNTTQSMMQLAILYQKSGRTDEAGAVLLDMNASIRRLVEKAATFSSESQMLAYLPTFNEKNDFFQSFAHSYPGPEFNRANFDNALLYNGYLLENSRRLARSVATADAPTRETYGLWQSCQRRLADEYAKPVAERSSLPELEAVAEAHEKTLTRTLADFGETRSAPHWQEVQRQLRPAEAALEFIHYRLHLADSKTIPSYAALLLRPGDNAPVFIPLFEEKSLDSLTSTIKKRRIEYVENLYATAERGATEVERPRKSLYELIWQPIEPYLGETKTVYFSPSGLLHRLHLGAIPIGGGDEKLSDRFDLVQMGSTRQLVAAGAAPDFGQNRTALVFGGINFEPDSTLLAAADDPENLAGRGLDLGKTPEIGFAQTDSTLRGGSWKFLKGSEKEAAEIQSLLKNAGLEAETRTGSDATEENFKNTATDGPSPRIVHLATHGYFFPDVAGGKPGSEPVFKTSDHPMIRSGLILAGANHAWQTGKPLRPGMDDGILTAYEISQMNLSNTELVVLSACETGLGDIQGNEGVFGLQRAFKIAGAKYVIMSLWQVPDRATQELMGVFYQKWLGDGMALRSAFQAAQNEMKSRYPAPFYWAGFVLTE